MNTSTNYRNYDWQLDSEQKQRHLQKEYDYFSNKYFTTKTSWKVLSKSTQILKLILFVHFPVFLLPSASSSLSSQLHILFYSWTFRCLELSVLTGVSLFHIGTERCGYQTNTMTVVLNEIGEGRSDIFTYTETRHNVVQLSHLITLMGSFLLVLAWLHLISYSVLLKACRAMSLS